MKSWQARTEPSSLALISFGFVLAYLFNLIVGLITHYNSSFSIGTPGLLIQILGFSGAFLLLRTTQRVVFLSILLIVLSPLNILVLTGILPDPLEISTTVQAFSATLGILALALAVIIRSFSGKPEEAHFFEGEEVIVNLGFRIVDETRGLHEQILIQGTILKLGRSQVLVRYTDNTGETKESWLNIDTLQKMTSS